jgi:hypothetical protein
LDEETKEKLRGALLFFRGDRNNLKVVARISQDEEPKSCGAIFANEKVLKEIEEIVGSENIIRN